MRTVHLVLLLFLLAFAARALPLSGNFFFGPDPYFHLRMSELVVSNQGLPSNDLLSLQGRLYTYAPLLHTLFASLTTFSGIDLGLLILFLPAFYGALAVLLVYFFSKKLFNKRVAVFASLTIAITAFHVLRTAGYPRPDGLALLIIPAIIYLLYTKRFAPAVALSVPLVLLHPLSTLYLLSFIIFWGLVCRIKRQDFSPGRMVYVILVPVLVFLLWLNSIPYPIGLYLSSISFESVELGAFSFLSFLSLFTFSWIFILIGIFKLKNNLFLKTWFAFSLAYAVFGVRLGIFLTIPAAMVSGFGIDYALNVISRAAKASRASASRLASRLSGPAGLRAAFFLLIFLLAVASLFPRLHALDAFVSPEEGQAMLWLKENTSASSSIGAQWDRGHPLTYLAERKVVIDGYFEFAPQLGERNEAIKQISTTSDCSKISANADRWGMDYFFLHGAGLSARSFQNGILEAVDCSELDSVFHSQGAKIFRFA